MKTNRRPADDLLEVARALLLLQGAILIATTIEALVWAAVFPGASGSPALMSGADSPMAEMIPKETAHRISMLEQLRHADRLTTVGKLASGVAHELGTPLNVVHGRAKLIL